MDCSACRRLMNERLDGTRPTGGEPGLAEHITSCSSCRKEWELLRAMDRVLAEEPLVRAPAGFERGVFTEIARVTEARRRIESLVVPAACGTAAVGFAYGVHRLVNWDTVRSFTRGLGDSAGRVLAPLAEPAIEGSGRLSTWVQSPAVQGAMIAFAVAATVFLGVSALRAARQFNLEYHHQRS